mmetsp:Transcript_102219/g.312653  ORF Transcript_102219/g.312653 Transcript_102219/m.312653 type:complete len:251 (-) Transcript_102219:1255-2007(-)
MATPSGAGFSGFSSEKRSEKDEFSGTTNSRSSMPREYGRLRVSLASTCTWSSTMLTFSDSESSFGTDTEIRTDSLDCPHENVAIAGANARSSSNFFLRRSRSFASRACASACCARFSSCRFLSSAFLFFRFSFSLRSISLNFLSSRSSFNLRSSRCFSRAASSSGEGVENVTLVPPAMSISPGGAAGFDGALPFSFALPFFPSLSTPIVSAAFFKPIISPTSTIPFSFFNVVIIFLIICCFSWSALSTSR